MSGRAQRLREAAAPALVLALALARLIDPATREPVPAHERGPAPPPPPPREYTDAARALLGGLGPGDMLGDGFRIGRAEGPVDGHIELHLERGGILLTLIVARKGARPMPPARETERVDVYYTAPRPDDGTLTWPDVELLLESLEGRLDSEAPLPDGL